MVGPSGCGKTTLLRILAGIEKYDSGNVVWTDRTSDERVLSFAFQHLALLPWRTVADNIAFPIENDHTASARDDRVNAMIGAFGLEGFGEYYPGQLSGGMRQRVALARALITAPKLLVLDEPFGALDVKARLRLQDLILTRCTERSVSVLMVTHDLHEAVRVCERVLVLSPRPARIRGAVETKHWSKADRLRLTAAETAPFVCHLHAMLAPD